MHLLSGEGKGQEDWEVQPDLLGKISQGKLLCSTEGSVWELCGRAAGS